MTGPEHYREAEEKLKLARWIASPESGHSDEDATVLVGLALQRAQVHATLALAAASAVASTADSEAWTAAASAYKPPVKLNGGAS